MAVRLYNEYIKVDPNFIPVFSKNSDNVAYGAGFFLSLKHAYKQNPKYCNEKGIVPAFTDGSPVSKRQE